MLKIAKLQSSVPFCMWGCQHNGGLNTNSLVMHNGKWGEQHHRRPQKTRLLISYQPHELQLGCCVVAKSCHVLRMEYFSTFLALLIERPGYTIFEEIHVMQFFCAMMYLSNNFLFEELCHLKIFIKTVEILQWKLCTYNFWHFTLKYLCRYKVDLR